MAFILNLEVINISLKEQKYKSNVSFLKRYGLPGNEKLKLTTMACVRNSGIEDDSEDNSIVGIRGTVNDEKIERSISRSRSTIFELAYCNEWDYFATLTIDPDKYDRTDLDGFHKILTQFFRNYGRKFDTKIDFLLVPELHQDGKNWHLHGFFKGIPPEELQPFKIGDKMGKHIAEKLKNGETIYNWLAYAKRFGFCDLEPIRNHEACSKYITKYINKSLASSVKKLNAHLYYASRGLKRGTTLKKGLLTENIIPDYVGDYCSVTTFPFSPEMEEFLKNSII